MNDETPDEPLTDKLYWWFDSMRWKARSLVSGARCYVNRSLYKAGVCGAMVVVTHNSTDFNIYCSECDHELESSAYYFGPGECPECGTSLRTVIHTEGFDS